MVFVQYPALDDPDYPGKVVPDTVLGAELMARVLSDEPVTLESAAEEVPVATEAPVAEEPAAGTPAPEPLSAPGQTAAEETCAVPSE
ncbi:hypothetical protein GRS96_02230 [Rathayibacter sp. VKM Ac-2803]|nr:hypothetical protein [Rathayibacter sp. VKM Ac-2803]MWV48092.1 hypothetical protein [Rathayibacter sp. VKM Ac-2803]